MANLVKRENREVTRSASPEHRLDPFRMMDALLRWDPFRGDRAGFDQRLELLPRFDVKEHREEGESYYAMERSHGSFARSFTMPDGVDADSVTADLKQGVLTVQIPNKPEVQPKRIAIGKGGETKAKA